MNDFSFEKIEESFGILKIDMNSTEFAGFATEAGFTPRQLEAIEQLMEYLRLKKIESNIESNLRMSRLPKKDPKTFENFDFSVIRGRDVERLKCLPSLATIRAHKNLAFIGPAGTGKTHLAQAYGYECCQQGLSAYFIKMTELRDKFTAARRAGNEANIIKNLVRPSCLIIDEVGRCEFDKENTRLFFDLMDRRYCKDGNYNVIFTSNKMPSLWKTDFNEDDTLLCALDRIFDDALVFTIKGESYRGKRTERILLQIGKTKSESSEEPVLTKKTN